MNNQIISDEVISPSDLKSVMLDFGCAIRKARINKGYKSAEAFAFKFNLNRSAYYGWENGRNITIKKLIIVSKALEMPLPDFFKPMRPE